MLILIAYMANMSVCVLCEHLCSVPLFWCKIKNLKLFSEFVWLLCRRLLTLHPETQNELIYEREH